MTVWRVVHNLPLWRICVLNEFIRRGNKAIAILEVDEQRETQRGAAPIRRERVEL